MQRVFEIDVLDCPRCHARMRVMATLIEAEVVEKMLAYLGLATEVPAVARARAPPQMELGLDDFEQGVDENF